MQVFRAVNLLIDTTEMLVYVSPKVQADTLTMGYDTLTLYSSLAHSNPHLSKFKDRLSSKT